MIQARAAVVTGGAEGIGAAICHSLCNEAYQVIFTDISKEKGEKREKLLRKAGLYASFIEADVGNPEDWERVAGNIRAENLKVHVLVNNAGISDPTMKFPDSDSSRWNEVLRTNLTGMYLSANFLTPFMEEGGAIINIASTRAYQSEPGTLAYSASKGGVVSLTHSLALTLSSQRIRVNSISPGWIDTSLWKIPPQEEKHNTLDHGQHPSGRIGKPEDVANLVSFLASERGEWINGQDIVIDGGMTRKMIYFDREVMQDALSTLTGSEALSSELMDKAFKSLK